MIDAAEFVGPVLDLDRQLGLHKVAKYYYTTGWHETGDGAPRSSSTRRSGRACRPTCKAIVENACAACNVISEAWCQKNNAEAMEDLVKNQGVSAQPLPDDVVEALRARDHQDPRRGGRTRPGDQEGSQLLHGLQGEVRSLGGLFESEPVYHAKIRKA